MTAKSLRVLMVGNAPLFLHATEPARLGKVHHSCGNQKAAPHTFERGTHLTRYKVWMITAAKPPSAIGSPTCMRRMFDLHNSVLGKL